MSTTLFGRDRFGYTVKGEPIYLGNKEPYFRFTVEGIPYKVGSDGWVYEEKLTATKERLCDCPKENFSFNGRGCICGGK